MKLPIKASGQALMDSEGFLQIYFSKEGLSKSMEKNNSFTFEIALTFLALIQTK